MKGKEIIDALFEGKTIQSKISGTKYKIEGGKFLILYFNKYIKSNMVFNTLLHLSNDHQFKIYEPKKEFKEEELIEKLFNFVHKKNMTITEYRKAIIKNLTNLFKD